MTIKKVSQHSAAGPLAGYIFQFYRALYWLFRADSSGYIGIETQDDIEVKKVNGKYIFEQDKFSTNPDNSTMLIGNSKAFWNTLSIWLDILQNDKELGNKIEFLFVTNIPVNEHNILRQIDNSSNDSDYDSCIERLRSSNNFPETVVAIAQKVLESSDSELKCLLKRIHLVANETKDSVEPLISELIQYSRIPSDLIDRASDLINLMLGWLLNQTMEAWLKKENAVIPVQNFINALEAHKEILKRNKKFERSAHLIEVTEEDIEMHKTYMFVNQLQLIINDIIEIDDAITDFVRTGSEFLRLSDEGEITENDIEALEYEMIDRWKAIRKRNLRLNKSLDDIDTGYIIYDQTVNDYLLTIRGIRTEHGYFTRGAYHRLSNELKVGWHPVFEKFFNNTKE